MDQLSLYRWMAMIFSLIILRDGPTEGQNLIFIFRVGPTDGGNLLFILADRLTDNGKIILILTYESADGGNLIFSPFFRPCPRAIGTVLCCRARTFLDHCARRGTLIPE